MSTIQSVHCFVFLLACRYTYVQANLACDINAISQRWLWTKNGQLFNLDKLKCITVGWKIRNYYILLLEQCNSNGKRQVWKCDRNDSYYVWQEHSKGYLHYGDHGNYVSSHVNRNTALKWKRRGSNQTLCSEGKTHRYLIYTNTLDSASLLVKLKPKNIPAVTPI